MKNFLIALATIVALVGFSTSSYARGGRMGSLEPCKSWIVSEKVVESNGLINKYFYRIQHPDSPYDHFVESKRYSFFNDPRFTEGDHISSDKISSFVPGINKSIKQPNTCINWIVVEKRVISDNLHDNGFFEKYFYVMRHPDYPSPVESKRYSIFNDPGFTIGEEVQFLGLATRSWRRGIFSRIPHSKM